jgi:hypothetical protein
MAMSDGDLVSDEYVSDTIEVPTTGLVAPVSNPPESSVSGSSVVEMEQTSSPQVAPTTPRPSGQSSGSTPSLDDLKVVLVAASGNSCKTLAEIVKQTKLDKSVVLSCIDYLVSTGQLAKSSADYYCSLDAIYTMQKQISSFRNSFKVKSVVEGSSGVV